LQPFFLRSKYFSRMFNKSVFCSIILIACGVLCCYAESKAQKIHRSQLELNLNKDDEYFGCLRILFPSDTIQLMSREHDDFVVDSYYDDKNFLLITRNKYGNHILNAGEKISGKWVHDIDHYYLTPPDDNCSVELIELQIIDAITILATKKFRGLCFRGSQEQVYSLRNDGDEPGNQHGLRTSILRICKTGVREYSYQGLGTAPTYSSNDVISPQSNRPDK
jgi:hypothetical protein